MRRHTEAQGWRMMELPHPRPAVEQVPGEPPDGGLSASPRTGALRAGWIMPPFFHELPLDAPDSESAAQQLHSIATTVLPEHSTDDQYAFAYLLGSQLEPMSKGGAIYAGLCFLEAEGQPTSSTVLVSQVPHDRDDEDIVPTLVDTLRRSYPRDEVDATELPCGPAVFRIGAAPFAMEDPATGDVTPVSRNLIQTYVPMPNTEELLVFELSVYSADGWDLHTEVFAEILKTLEWATDAEIAQAAALSHNAPPAGAVSPVDDLKLQELHDILVALGTAVVGAALYTSDDKQQSTTTCAECWEKGLRTSCLARQQWRYSNIPPQELNTVLPRGTAHLAKSGWHIESRNPEQLSAHKNGNSLILNADPRTGQVLAEVSTLCARVSNTTVSDDFG